MYTFSLCFQFALSACTAFLRFIAVLKGPTPIGFPSGSRHRSPSATRVVTARVSQHMWCERCFQRVPLFAVNKSVGTYLHVFFVREGPTPIGFPSIHDIDRHRRLELSLLTSHSMCGVSDVFQLVPSFAVNKSVGTYLHALSVLEGPTPIGFPSSSERAYGTVAW